MKIRTKQSKTDFEITQLPQTRVEVFKDVIKLHWRSLLVLASVLFVGVLPILACLFIRDNYALSLAAKVVDGKMTPEERLAVLKVVHLICAGACWVFSYIFGIALCIVTRFIRQLVWYEPIFVKEDIKMALKNGYKSMAVCVTFMGLALLVYKAMLFVTDNVIVQVIPFALFLTFIATPFILAYYQSMIYEGKFFRLVKNALLMYLREVPRVLFFGLLLFTPLLFAILQSHLMIKYIVLVVYFFIFEPLFLMMYQLSANHIFDKYINRENYPKLYKKGLYVESIE